jgi:phosphoribosylformylglycinamidine synthase
MPRGLASAGVIAPIPGSKLGVALAVAGDPFVGARDAYAAGVQAVTQAVARVVLVGARPIALTDCLNFGNPNDPDQLGEMVAAIEGLADAASDLDLPFISGNVSLYNASSSGKAIPASPIVACIGVIDDITHVIAPGAA